MRNIKNKKLNDFVLLLNKSIDLDGYFKYHLSITKDNKLLNLLIFGDSGGAIRLKLDISESCKPVNDEIKRIVDIGIEYMVRYIIWSERTEREPNESVRIYSWPETLDEIKRLRNKNEK